MAGYGNFGGYGLPYGYPYNNFPGALIANASGIRGGQNPPYTQDDFFNFYPQFQGLPGLPEFVLNQFIGMANAVVKQDAWGVESWQFGMANFIAHFSTIFIQSTVENCATSQSIVSAASARGLVTSEAAGNLSASYDYTALTDGLKGWGDYQTTQYGRNFANFAKFLGRAGVSVW